MFGFFAHRPFKIAVSVSCSSTKSTSKIFFMVLCFQSYACAHCVYLERLHGEAIFYFSLIINSSPCLWCLPLAFRLGGSYSSWQLHCWNVTFSLFLIILDLYNFNTVVMLPMKLQLILQKICWKFFDVDCLKRNVVRCFNSVLFPYKFLRSCHMKGAAKYAFADPFLQSFACNFLPICPVLCILYLGSPFCTTLLHFGFAKLFSCLIWI